MGQQKFNLFTNRRILAVVAALLGIAFVVSAVLIGRIILDRGDDDSDIGTPTGDGISTGVEGIRLESAGELAVGGGSSVGAGLGRLLISLSQGQEQLDRVELLQVVAGTPLSEEEIQRILDRLPELAGEVGDVQDFRLPESSLPPPLTGETVDEPFPPPEAPVVPEPVAAGPLEVLRFAPEGEIPLAPFLNVTFNQPMVPLATLEQLSAADVPLKLTPSIPGIWKWLGTKTLSFEYDSDEIDRFPMATTYVAEVPAGTTSATGGVLAESVSWTFSTPPPQVESFYPQDSPQGLEPLIFVAFDQLIEPEAVLSTIRMTADGQSVPLRLAGSDEIEADERVSRLVKNASESRWLVFRPEQALPGDSGITVTIGPGTPSAEGPLVTEEAQSYTFRTYARLRITDHRCGWYDRECPPFAPFIIEFNNPIDLALYEESMLTIEPALPGVTVNIFDQSVNIRGASQGRTTYKVKVSGAIQDIFGQTLGEDQTVEFKVGSAPSALTGPEKILVTVDPSADDPTLSVYSINFNNLHVRIYDVGPSDWPAYKFYLREFSRQEDPPDPPGSLVYDETIDVEAIDDKLTETAIDLGDFLDGEYGHLIVIVEPPSRLLDALRNRGRQISQTWVQVTQIGLDAFADHSELVVWANDLQDGTPLSGLTVELERGGGEAVTGASGLARFMLPDNGGELLVARRDTGEGQDIAILPSSQYFWEDAGWQRRPVTDELRWYVFDDRQMYRPGEEVHIKGWMRRVGGKQDGDVGLVGDGLSSVRYWVMGPQGNELTSGSVDVNSLGGFNLEFSLPENANLGYAYLNLEAVGSAQNLYLAQYSHNFQIQEFRRPEFEVSARNETEGPFLVNEYAVVAVSANYFAGGPLPNAEVNWMVTSTPGNYSPPNWPDFIFGFWNPWWFEPVFFEGYYDPFVEDSRVETFSGQTDAAGNHYLRIDFEAMDESRPFNVQAEATVFDVNRQAWAATTQLLVHPSDLYVGLRSERTFVERGMPLEIETIVADLDGNPVAGRPIVMTAARLEWKYRDGNWGEEAVDIQECNLTSTNEPLSCTFETTVGGQYQITATVTDDKGRQNKSQFTRWVSGGQRPPARQVEQESVTLIPDKESYQPGDVAQILVEAPFSPAEGLLTVSRSGLLKTERFTMAEGSTTLQVPIESAHIPNLYVQVDLVGAAPRTNDQGETVEGLPPRPAYATGQLSLNIPPVERTLSLEATPQDKALEPGGETIIDVVVTDANGQPVADAELAVVVVDEAILALTDYQLADPVAAFYANRGSDVFAHHSRASIILANPQALADQFNVDELQNAMVVEEEVMVEGEAMMEMAVPAEPMATDVAMREAASQAEAPIQVRTDFNPLATFAPSVRTDGSGRAQVPVQLPDNLTRYRVMVVAVAGGRQFGTGEANLTARLPLMVRPSAPRFLNFGDRFELPVVLQNQTDDPLMVDVAIQAVNIELTAGQGQRVEVPANNRVEVRFPATTISPGTARLQIAAVSGNYADAATVELPVYTPATTEAFATYGVVDEGAVAQPVAAPENIFPQFGGLEITTSSTAVQALTDAVLYLVEYPFECSEQMASRILAVAALRDVLTAFSAEGLPSPEELEKAVERDIETLQSLQNDDGGFPVWRRGRESVPFYSIHVAHALQRARMKGFSVPDTMIQRSLEHLRRIEDYYPSWYGKQTRQTLSAYALYVRHLMGDADPDKALRLYDEAGLENLSLEAVAWIWQVLSDEPQAAGEVEAIRRTINNRAVETAGAANFTTDYGDEAYVLLHSNRRTDGVILDALISDQPDSDLIPKVVNGLLAHRTRGRWSNTQENVFILLALDRYFNTFEAQTPDFVARIWLGDTYAGSHEFAGRTTERHQTDIPMGYLIDTPLGEGETQDLILSKEGPGRLYYRLGLRYAPEDLDLDPLDMGFIVQRSYEAVDDPEDVYQDEAGVWHMKAGARVRVRLTMVADNRRYHVALIDPLPAGLEIVNPALAVSGSIPQDPGDPTNRYGWWWWWTWYEHQNMRDQRAEAFTTLLWEGVYNYSYVARATTPGDFVVPPTKAEEMYSPEVFGRSGSDRVIIE